MQGGGFSPVFSKRRNELDRFMTSSVCEIGFRWTLMH